MQSCCIGIFVAGIAVTACGADTQTTAGRPPSQSLREISPSGLKIVPMAPEASAPIQTEAARPPANPALTESRTSEEAAQARAADPKDASGANIIKVPFTGATP